MKGISISENIKWVRESIAEAAIKSGRDPSDITLVAASKTHSADDVKEAIRCGVDAVGENRVQEMLEKHDDNAYLGAPLHFIGHLQSNKVNKIVGLCDLIESVGSKALIETIGKRAESLGIVQNVLIEVNVGKEQTKSGIMIEETEGILEYASRINGVKVVGLMAIPPILDKNNELCYYFDTMYKLFVDMCGKKYDNNSMQFLSMGMSDSYIDAIRTGANMVRIGSAIFGTRSYYS